MHGLLRGVWILVLLGWSVGAEAQGYRWTMVREGGKEAFNTDATATNDAGWIVGRTSGFRDPYLRPVPWRYQKGRFIRFDVPGVEGETNVFVNGLGQGTTIVGTYWVDPPCEDCGDGMLHAYLYRHGLQDHIIIDVPGAFWSFAFNVNDRRQVAMGYFAQPDPDPATWGAAIFDYATNTHWPITVFGSTEVTLTGLNNRGDYVGSVTTAPDRTVPFAHWRGQDLVLTHPAGVWPAGPFIWPTAINDAGLVVGGLDNDGFVLDLETGQWRTLRHPVRREGFTTVIKDIDNYGRMVVTNWRHTDGYTESWWVRPVEPKVATR